MYTYALLQTPSQLKMPDGMEHPVQLVCTPYLAAAVELISPVQLQQLEQDNQQLLQAILHHDRVIQALFQQTTVLPLRFGTRFPSSEALLAHLESNQHTYLEKLLHLNGQAEYSLNCVAIAAPESQIADEITGKEYFLAKKSLYQAQTNHQKQQQQELAALLHSLQQQYCVATAPQPTGNIKVYILAHQEQKFALAQELQFLQQQLTYWQLSLGEAHPPYHFASSSTE